MATEIPHRSLWRGRKPVFIFGIPGFMSFKAVNWMKQVFLALIGVKQCSKARKMKSSQTSAIPHLYVHGDRDILAMVEADMLAIWDCTEESRTSLTVLPFNLIPLPDFKESAWPFLAACNSVARPSTRRVLNT